jgi:hypothetical protein
MSADAASRSMREHDATALDSRFAASSEVADRGIDDAKRGEVDDDLETAAPEYGDDEYPDEADSYRSLSKGAIVSLILTILAQPMLWWVLGDETIFYVVLALPLIGAILGFTALLKILRHPDELTGKWPALIGTVAGALTVVGGIGLQAYILMTEVPDGYKHISWYDLKPHDANEPLPIPREMLRLHDKKVFIKGYVHPSVSGTGPVDKCMLVGDMDTCCFGGNPKLVERIDAVFENNLKISYSTRRRKLGGTLKLLVNPNDVRTFFKPDDGTAGPYYVLMVDYLK